jgi:uncharacterized ferredoxin-like protein
MQEALGMVAALMEVAARTAPKSAGQDFVQVKILAGDDVKQLAEAMVAYGEGTGKARFDRDGGNVSASDVVVLIGLKDATYVGLNCGMCGFASCQEMASCANRTTEFLGPQCGLRLLDLGIALGSAVKTASSLNVDNRIMYRIGVVARAEGVVDWDVVMGVPLSATGKSIYFDRA